MILQHILCLLCCVQYGRKCKRNASPHCAGQLRLKYVSRGSGALETLWPGLEYGSGEGSKIAVDCLQREADLPNAGLKICRSICPAKPRVPAEDH